MQTGFGELDVRTHEVCHRSGGGDTIRSSLLPPYLNRTCSTEELIPCLCLSRGF